MGEMRAGCFACTCLVLVSLAHSYVNTLPDVLLRPPEALSPETPLLKGRFNRDQLAIKPRALLGYLSARPWAFLEFVSMMQSSWRLQTTHSNTKARHIWGYRMHACMHADCN